MLKHARLPLAAGVVVGSLGLAGVASGLPSTKVKLIVPGQSIGAVSLGLSKARATGHWGTPDRCVQSTEITCIYGGFSTPSNDPNQAGFSLLRGKVTSIYQGQPVPDPLPGGQLPQPAADVRDA